MSMSARFYSASKNQLENIIDEQENEDFIEKILDEEYCREILWIPYCWFVDYWCMNNVTSRDNVIYDDIFVLDDEHIDKLRARLHDVLDIENSYSGTESGNETYSARARKAYEILPMFSVYNENEYDDDYFRSVRRISEAIETNFIEAFQHYLLIFVSS